MEVVVASRYGFFRTTINAVPFEKEFGRAILGAGGAVSGVGTSQTRSGALLALLGLGISEESIGTAVHAFTSLRMQELVGVRALSAELCTFRALGAFRRAGRALKLIVAILTGWALV